ncbi:hypothetical protein NVSP9465_01724 [Novosphingobium sp. CECT 9465]|nr:hypothetical protein NVSP9465_01724 [Novosphingobium sp. CECT 9465]
MRPSGKRRQNRKISLTTRLAIIVNAAVLWPFTMAVASSHFLGIDPKMYRHFAMATVAISTIVAVFADGESQQAMAHNRKPAEIKQAEKPKFGKATLADNREDGGKRKSGGSGFHGQFGAPMDGSSAAGGNSGVIPAGLVLAPPPIIVEVNQNALARMTPEQRAAYLKRLEEERQRRMNEGPTVPSPAQVSALAASSAARSGSEEID